MLSKAKHLTYEKFDHARTKNILRVCVRSLSRGMRDRDDMKNMQTTQRYTLADIEKWMMSRATLIPLFAWAFLVIPVAFALSGHAKCRPAQLRDQRAICAFSYTAE